MRFTISPRERVLAVILVLALSSIPAVWAVRAKNASRSAADAEYLAAQGKADRAIAAWQAASAARK